MSNLVRTAGRPIGFVIGLVLIGFMGPARCADQQPRDSIVIDGTLHSPSEILTLMERSRLRYTINPFPDSEWTREQGKETLRVVSENYFITEDSDKITLSQFTLSDSCRLLLEEAEVAFQAKDYEAALRLYRETMLCEPSYTKALVLIGDVFYSRQEFDSAIVYFREAIKRNRIDYQAHWFLADALAESDMKDEAVKEMTLAHVLNRNHENIRNGLSFHREEIGRKWEDWTFEPRYSVTRDTFDSLAINVRCDTLWLGYALAKALWQFEPDYASKMRGGKKDTLLFNPVAEKEALICLLAIPDKFPRVHSIVMDGYADEFIYYELMARSWPESILILPNDVLMRMAEYVDKYH